MEAFRVSRIAFSEISISASMPSHSPRKAGIQSFMGLPLNSNLLPRLTVAPSVHS